MIPDSGVLSIIQPHCSTLSHRQSHTRSPPSELQLPLPPSTPLDIPVRNPPDLGIRYSKVRLYLDRFVLLSHTPRVSAQTTRCPPRTSSVRPHRPPTTLCLGVSIFWRWLWGEVDILQIFSCFVFCSRRLKLTPHFSHTVDVRLARYDLCSSSSSALSLTWRRRFMISRKFRLHAVQ